MVSFSTVIRSFSLGSTYLLRAFTHFISFNVRFCLLLALMCVPRTLDYNLTTTILLRQVPTEDR